MADDQLVVGGESAGGGLTAAVTLLARDRGEIAVAFQVPLYPMLDDRPTGSSRNNTTPVWNTVNNDTAGISTSGIFVVETCLPMPPRQGRQIWPDCRRR